MDDKSPARQGQDTETTPADRCGFIVCRDGRQFVYGLGTLKHLKCYLRHELQDGIYPEKLTPEELSEVCRKGKTLFTLEAESRTGESISIRQSEAVDGTTYRVVFDNRGQSSCVFLFSGEVVVAESDTVELLCAAFFFRGERFLGWRMS